MQNIFDVNSSDNPSRKIPLTASDVNKIVNYAISDLSSGKVIAENLENRVMADALHGM